MSRSRIDIGKVSELPLTHEEIIPEDYLDMMGHMNVMWYTHLFSISLLGQFLNIGFTREHMKANRAGSFALETFVRYHSEVLLGQQVALYARVLGRSDRRLHGMHFMVNRDKQDLAATMEIVTTHVNMSTRRSSPFPPSITARIDELSHRHAELDWAAPTCGAMKP